MGIELATIHGGSLSCVRFTQAGVAQEKSRTVGTCRPRACLDNHETVLLPILRFLRMGRLLAGAGATSK